MSDQVNIENLNIVLEHLRALPAEANNFGMRRWYEKADNDCGFVACTLGHAAIALGDNIIENPDNRPYQPKLVVQGYENRASSHYGGWDSYAEDNLGIFVWGELGKWLFDGGWQLVDDTAAGAVKRIEYYLEHKDIHPDFNDNFDKVAVKTNKQIMQELYS